VAGEHISIESRQGFFNNLDPDVVISGILNAGGYFCNACPLDVNEMPCWD
jgi:hypothetical protein